MRGLVRTTKIIAVAALAFVISMSIPYAVGQFWPIIVLASGVITFWATRDAAATATVASVEAASPGVTSNTIRQGKVKLWGSAAAFVAVIAGFFLWMYTSSESQRFENFKQNVTSETQNMMGPNFVVESVSFPNGVSTYETIVMVVFTIVATQERDNLTLSIRGNCNDVCRAQIDPRDALRLAPYR